MTLEEIVERNVKIAKFIGFTPVYPNMPNCDIFRYRRSFPKFDQALYVTEASSTGSSGRFVVKNITQRVIDTEFEFHFNMGWLMPIVELIESLQEGVFRVMIDDKTCAIYHVENKDSKYVEVTAETKVDAVWQAVLEFIDIWDGLQKLFPEKIVGWDWHYIDGLKVEDVTRTGKLISTL